MAELAHAALVAIPIESFRRLSRDIGFDVFIRLSDENVAHVFSRATGLDYQRLANYIQKGITQLWIRAEDHPAYLALVARPAQAIFEDPSTSPERKIATLLNMTEQNMAEIFSTVPVREQTAEDSQTLVRSYLDMMTHEPKSLSMLLKMACHGEQLYSHCVAVSIFSLFIAKASGQFDRRMMELIGLGGFLHDIGCSQLPRELIDSETEYSKEQRTAYEEHVRLGLNMLKENPVIPDEVRYMVYQHHEQSGGRGFPNRLGSGRIFYPARVVALADAFSGLISRRPYRAALTAEQAIRRLEADGAQDRALVALFASTILRDERDAA